MGFRILIENLEAYNGHLTDLVNSDLISYSEQNPYVYVDPNRNNSILRNPITELK